MYIINDIMFTTYFGKFSKKRKNFWTKDRT